jgi:hypothetical protein
VKGAAIVVAVVVALGATSASAYTVRPGDFLIRGVTGAGVNVARLNVATKATPPAGMIMGVDLDWSFDGEWSLATSLRPTLAPGFVDTNVGVGAKYRVLALDAPFIPFVMGQLTTALGGPLGYGDVHWNVGARLGGGVDYFVMRDLAGGVEIGSEGSLLAVPLLAPEWTTEVLLGVTWRL